MTGPLTSDHWLQISLSESESLTPVALYVLAFSDVVLPTGTAMPTSEVHITEERAGVNRTSEGLRPCPAPGSAIRAPMNVLNDVGSFFKEGFFKLICFTSLSVHAGTR